LRDFQRSGTEKHYSGSLERAPLRAPKALLKQAFIRAVTHLKLCCGRMNHLLRCGAPQSPAVAGIIRAAAPPKPCCGKQLNTRNPYCKQAIERIIQRAHLLL